VVLPDEMMPVEGDETNLKEIQRKKKLRIEIMSGCDAVLLVAPPETLAANADIVVVGRNERHSACARAERNFLPCALLDGVPIVSPGLRQTAAELDVQWLDVTREPWTPTVQDWLRRSAEKAGGDDR
jgi:hypothetical protein